MQIAPKRKNCLEVSGGRLTYQADYEMPGLAMRISSRQSRHCAQGGGEVHYVSSCASGRITRMMLADICGSQDVFLRLSCELRNGLMRNINSIWQNRVVANMSDHFRDFAARGGFAAASVATFFAPTRSFVMCNIGNPPPLIYRSRQRQWEVLHGEVNKSERESVTPEGAFPVSQYRYINTKLDVDDIVVLYGNGFAQSELPGGDTAGHNRLLSALQDSPRSDPRSRVDHLIRLIQENDSAEEDSNVFVCDVTRTNVRLRDNLLAPLRLFQRPRDETQFTTGS